MFFFRTILPPRTWWSNNTQFPINTIFSIPTSPKHMPPWIPANSPGNGSEEWMKVLFTNYFKDMVSALVELITSDPLLYFPVPSAALLCPSLLSGISYFSVSLHIWHTNNMRPSVSCWLMWGGLKEDLLHTCKRSVKWSEEETMGRCFDFDFDINQLLFSFPVLPTPS